MSIRSIVLWCFLVKATMVYAVPVDTVQLKPARFFWGMKAMLGTSQYRAKEGEANFKRPLTNGISTFLEYRIADKWAISAELRYSRREETLIIVVSDSESYRIPDYRDHSLQLPFFLHRDIKIARNKYITISAGVSINASSSGFLGARTYYRCKYLSGHLSISKYWRVKNSHKLYFIGFEYEGGGFYFLNKEGRTIPAYSLTYQYKSIQMNSSNLLGVIGIKF